MGVRWEFISFLSLEEKGRVCERCRSSAVWSDSWEMQHIGQGCCKLERCGAVLGRREGEGLVQLSSSAGQIFND